MIVRITIPALCILVIYGTTTVHANPSQAGALTWAFQNTTILDGGSPVLTMRNGLAWPVVLETSVSVSGGLGAYSLFPAVGQLPSGKANWLGIGRIAGPTGRWRSASSPDGRVAYAFGMLTGPSSSAISSVCGGWGTLPADTKAVSFGPDGQLFTATRNAVAGAPPLPSTDIIIIDMDVSPFGDIGVIDSSMTYWHYSNWTGAWANTSIKSVTQAPTLIPDSMDIEFDALGRPHLVGTASSQVWAFDFSTVTGSWSGSAIGASTGQWVTLAADSTGTVGTAWVAPSNGGLIYAFKDDNADWITSIVTIDATMGKSPSIAYDYADLPVIAYYGPSNMMLAYDPIVVPEPAVLGLLAVGSVLLLRRHSR